MENADAVEADMGLQTAGAIKFCFRKLIRADVRTRKRADPALLAETPVKQLPPVKVSPSPRHRAVRLRC
jgi:hypothetical protein